MLSSAFYESVWLFQISFSFEFDSKADVWDDVFNSRVL